MQPSHTSKRAFFCRVSVCWTHCTTFLQHHPGYPHRPSGRVTARRRRLRCRRTVARRRSPSPRPGAPRPASRSTSAARPRPTPPPPRMAGLRRTPRQTQNKCVSVSHLLFHRRVSHGFDSFLFFLHLLLLYSYLLCFISLQCTFWGFVRRAGFLNPAR